MRIKIWEIEIDILTKQEIIEIVDDNIKKARLPMQITGVNPEVIIKSRENIELRHAIKKSTIINIDGIAVALALKMLGYKRAIRVACPDIFDSLISTAEKSGYRVFFLGARQEILEKMITNLRNKYPKLIIAGSINGYYDSSYVKTIAMEIKSSNADILFIGMPTPAKELFISTNMTFLNIPLSFGVGGYFDILAGVFKRAPKWLQFLGLEWLFRLLQEPKRMFKRQLNIYKFLILFLRTFSLNRKESKLLKMKYKTENIKLKTYQNN